MKLLLLSLLAAAALAAEQTTLPPISTPGKILISPSAINPSHKLVMMHLAASLKQRGQLLFRQGTKYRVPLKSGTMMRGDGIWRWRLGGGPEETPTKRSEHRNTASQILLSSTNPAPVEAPASLLHRSIESTSGQ